MKKLVLGLLLFAVALSSGALSSKAHAQSNVRPIYGAPGNNSTPVDTTHPLPVTSGGGGGTIPVFGAIVGYVQITPTIATGLTSPPAAATFAVIAAEAGNVRWRADGTAPTATVGMPFWGTAFLTVPLAYFGSIQFINMTGSTSVLNVMYYQGS